jgi:hypothetical protein
MIFKIILTVLALGLVAIFIWSLIGDAGLVTRILCGVASVFMVFVSICEWVQPKFLRIE